MRKPVFEEEAYEHFRHEGDPEPTRANLNTRWGDVRKLLHSATTSANRSAAMIFTPTTPDPRPIAIQIRFSLDGKTWHAANPSSTATVTFQFTSQIHLKSGQILDRFTIAQDQVQPFSQLIATGLNMTATIDSSDEFNDDELWVAVTACPVCCVDGDVSPGGNTVPATTKLATYALTSTSRFTVAELAAASAGPGINLTVAEDDRAQFFIQNNSAVDIWIGLPTASGTPGSENGICLPGGIHAIYEASPGCYGGAINLFCDPAAVDADGIITAIVGRYS